MYGGMEPKDLEAMYAYFMSLKPIKNAIPAKFKANTISMR